VGTSLQQKVIGAAATLAIWHVSHAQINQDRRRRITCMNIELTMAFGMIERRPLNSRSIQFLVLLGSLLALPFGLAAQDQDHDHHAADPAAATPGWSWTTDANLIFGYNYQQRRFADFWAWESQNWAMLSGNRRVGPGRLTVAGMLSAEPWTIGRLVYAQGSDGSPQRLYAFNAQRERVPLGGSPQTFQTGESYLGAPLINYQHPHDLVMELGAT